jgi:dTDP-glucose 4,6-dehydratase
MLPTGLLLVLDSAAWPIATASALALRFEFELEITSFLNGAWLGLALAGMGALAGLATHLYRGRYVTGSMEEAFALFATVAPVFFVGGLLVVSFGNDWGIPRSTVFIATPIFLILAGGFRFLTRYSGLRTVGRTGPSKRALVYGAGDAAELLITQLFGQPDSPYRPVVLVDDAPDKKNRWIRGVPMGGTWSNLETLVGKFGVETVIVAIPSAESELLSRVYLDSRQLGLEVVVLPTLREYLGGRSTARELRTVSIEDLIGRQSLELGRDVVSSFLAGKKVLVTGAGGSIGSELVRQIADSGPSQLTLVDRDETALLLASLGVQSQAGGVNHDMYLLDIRDRPAVVSLFHGHRPDIVFHAAALKHLPILEAFPEEGWKTNVEGTLNVLESAREGGVSVFVNISTDKAANPANVLGRSKRLAEELTAWFGSQTGDRYVSVRFGNVLGSRGSLIPILADQIAAGGPLTITHKEATRYFMSIPEACQLVLQAAAEGEGGDVLVLDMGDPVRIQDIANRMIELSGRSIDIIYTVLRPGEKLHEDLLSDTETAIPAAHPKIMRLKATPKSPEEVLAEKW